MRNAIEVSHLSKLYKIKMRQARYRTLREALTQSFSRLRSRGNSARPTSLSSDEVWALKDIDFEVKPGEVVGIIGRNGAGKSTLLKILSRIVEPSAGYAEIQGRVGSLLEVGAGFHQELTGRENIYLNGAILGMKRFEIVDRFDEIVGFAELERFIDTPVKHYSSGMYMRLAFAVAAHLEPEVLLVDEVLAVGDAAFQKRCIGKMNDVAKDGRTVLFVSHNLGAVRDLCQRGIWLDDGALIADDEADYVVRQYLGSVMKNQFSQVCPDHGLIIEEIVLRNANGESTLHFCPGDDLVVEVSYDASRIINKPYVWIAVQSLHGRCFVANMQLDGHRPKTLEGRGRLTCRFKGIPLLPQSYSIVMAVRTGDGRDSILKPQDVAWFDVAGDLTEMGFRGELMHKLLPKSFPVVVPYEWTLPDGTTAPVEVALQPIEIS
jgi:lipopolysaccharide transport system ATP-binding protein